MIYYNNQNCFSPQNTNIRFKTSPFPTVTTASYFGTCGLGGSDESLVALVVLMPPVVVPLGPAELFSLFRAISSFRRLTMSSGLEAEVGEEGPPEEQVDET